ncbi:PHD and RING finger domain-containing protein 1-like [Trypanosoma cruzi]|nr:PHD and RING finger domain-containing protein 1-like [Trypanosoma cruzi]
MASGVTNGKVAAERVSDDEICGICFTKIYPFDNPRGRLNSCSHIFCAYCIKEWAQSTNVCPHCKARFTRIFTVDPEGKEEITKVRKRNYRLWEDEEEEEEDQNNRDDNRVSTPIFFVCHVCGESDNASRMILCDRRQCSNTVHLDCVNLSEQPAGYFCPDCTRLRASVSVAITSSSLSSATLLAATDAVSETPLNSERPKDDANDTDNSTPLVASHPEAVPPCQINGKKVFVAPPAWLQEAVERSTSQHLEARRPLPLEAPTISSDFAPQTSSVPHETRRSGETPTVLPDEDEELHRSAEAAMQQFTQRQAQKEQQIRHRRQRQPGSPSYDPALLRATAQRSKRFHSSANVPMGCAETTDVLDPESRHREEEALARRLALEILPILRRNRILQEHRIYLGDNGSIVAASLPSKFEGAQGERDLYNHAMTEGRRIARERMETKLGDARRRKERLIRVQAQRESVALAKLARIVASHRAVPRMK